MLNSSAATYGWCDRCRDRTGSRRYRKLTNGLCEDCDRSLRKATGGSQNVFSSEQTTDALFVNTEEIPSATTTKRKRKKTRVRYKGLREKRTKVAICQLNSLKQDEYELVDALSRIECGYHWHNLAAEYLGWPRSRVRTVSRRLFKKGYRIRDECEDRLMEIVCQNPWSNAFELTELSAWQVKWTYEILKRLIKKKQIVTIRVNKGSADTCAFRYGVENKTMNLLFYSFKLKPSGDVGCVCAYSHKFGGYGIFAEAWPVGIVEGATRSLDKPTIAVGSILEFQSWINAHTSAMALYPECDSLKASGIVFRGNYALSELISKVTEQEYILEQIIPLNVMEGRGPKHEWRQRNYLSSLKSCLCLVTQARDLFAIAQSGQLRLPNGKRVGIDLYE